MREDGIHEGSYRGSLLPSVALWCAVAVWAGFIFLMSAHTGSDLMDGDGFTANIRRWLAALTTELLGSEIDVVSPIAHFVEYAIFGALLLAALRATSPDRPLRASTVMAIALAGLYGATDELHQLFVPGRACDPLDWLVDVCGAALGALIAVALFRRCTKER